MTVSARPIPHPALPDRPPFAIRARILTPTDAGPTVFHPDGIVEVGADGRIAWVGPADLRSGIRPEARPGPDAAAGSAPIQVTDLRPLILAPGMVDLHAHLPQVPNAGLGAGLDLLTWLERYIFPLERRFDDAAAAAELAPAAFRAFAAVGTTTILAYGAVYAASMDGAFRAAEAHGIRAILGKVMMDRVTYDETIDPSTIIERSIRESEELCARWHGLDGGRLGYAVTPRFAVSCTAEMLRESAALAARTGAWWQTHVSEDPGEIAEVRRLFPDARDYVDVYDRAGGLGERTILAHAIHLSELELGRLVETGTRVAHCPASNLFLASGVMPLARYLDAGLAVGLGSDVAGGPDPSIFSVMRVGAYAQNARRALLGEDAAPLGPLDWLRLGSLAGAQALGLGDRIGSLEVGKEADIIAIDAGLTAPTRHVDLGAPPHEPIDLDPSDIASRLMFRPHPEMVRGAWVRGRRLEGPGLPAYPG
ncbi:MAG TPA: amidohydrolase family protein [Candidatus Sulfomarinibacteraceae bacterium]|nr:amidohydrolase family protein [Candidatus Sulfomarinibacteraceae bacterium]